MDSMWKEAYMLLPWHQILLWTRHLLRKWGTNYSPYMLDTTFLLELLQLFSNWKWNFIWTKLQFQSKSCLKISKELYNDFNASIEWIIAYEVLSVLEFEIHHCFLIKRLIRRLKRKNVFKLSLTSTLK